MITSIYIHHSLPRFQSEPLNLEKVKIISEYAEKARSCCGDTMKVYSTIGNHDSFPVDQLQLPPNKFLNDISRIWAMHGLPAQALEDVRRGGFYTLPIAKGLRLITINTQWTNEINFWLYVNSTMDHAGQMKWMEAQFAKAEADNEKILLLGHIPPKSRWPADKYEHFYNLIKRYSSRVICQLYGHQHSDNFKLMVDDNGVAFSSLFVGGVMVAGGGKNSAIRLYKYDKSNFNILDYDEYIANIKDANTNGKLEYKKGYSFTEEFKVPDATVASLQRVHKSFVVDDVNWKKYMYNYRSQYSQRQCSGQCKKDTLAEMLQKPAKVKK
jgi:hypothetical protein